MKKEIFNVDAETSVSQYPKKLIEKMITKYKTPRNVDGGPAIPPEY